MIEADLVTLLKNTAGVTAIAGQRVYPAPAPEGAALPNVTWQQITDLPTRAAAGVLNYRRTRLQVNVWAAKPSEVVNLSNAVRAALDGWQSGAVQVCVTENVTNLLDTSFAPVRHGRALDVAISHKE